MPFSTRFLQGVPGNSDCINPCAENIIAGETDPVAPVRPHEALAMKCPAEIYSASSRPYFGLPDLTYPLHDRDALVTACGRICMHRKRVNISTVLAGQRLGIKEVDDGIWIVSFMHYDIGFIDLEQKTLQPLDNPFGTGLSPMS